MAHTLEVGHLCRGIRSCFLDKIGMDVLRRTFAFAHDSDCTLELRALVSVAPAGFGWNTDLYMGLALRRLPIAHMIAQAALVRGILHHENEEG